MAHARKTHLFEARRHLRYAVRSVPTYVAFVLKMAADDAL